MAALNQNVLALARQNLTPAAGTRNIVRATLDAEFAAALAMPDDVFWGYDAAWMSLGTPELVDARRAGAGGGGGANMSWNNNQFWKLAQQCDRGLFTLVMYQQRRYMAAQIRMVRHLAAVPQMEVLRGFDRMPTELDVRRACGGVEVRDKAHEWAYWCEEAVRLIGAARWASNFSWSDSSRSCGDAVYRVDAQPIVGPYDTGCRYLPDCSTDAFGVARLGYVAGSAPDGIARWEAIVGNGGQPAPSMRADLVEAARSWTIRWSDRNESYERGARGAGTPLGFGALWPVSISPAVLGLHVSSRTRQMSAEVPTGSQAFNGAWFNPGPSWSWPAFLAASGTNAFGDNLLAYFLELPAAVGRGSSYDPVAALAAQKPMRDRTGCWYWKYEASGSGASGVATNLAYAAPASELIIWRLIAHLRDIVAKPFGQVVIDGFTNLDRAVQGIPADLRGDLGAVAAAVQSAAAAVRREQAATVGSAFAAAAGGAAAINPIAGIVVGVLGSLTTALVGFSLEIGLARGANPPVLQTPALRVAPPTLAGDDRCWVNQGDLESTSAYQARVTAPYAEAARAAGGDAGRLFDLVPAVRVAQFCAQNPADPRCASPPSNSSSSSWGRWLAGAAGTTAGFALIKLLGG